MSSRAQGALIAGAISGIAGLLVFLTVHHFWIRPIWFILPIGAMIAAIGGAAVGWAYLELMPALPLRPWSALAMVALISLILAPSVMLAELRAPLFDITDPENATLAVSTGRAAVTFTAELVLTSAAMGALLGWLIGRTRTTSAATALASVVFALGPGHNIPFLGGTPATMMGVTILLIVILVSAVVLVEAEWRLRGFSMQITN
jgi:hypothetical protein